MSEEKQTTEEAPTRRSKVITMVVHIFQVAINLGILIWLGISLGGAMEPKDRNQMILFGLVCFLYALIFGQRVGRNETYKMYNQAMDHVKERMKSISGHVVMEVVQQSSVPERIGPFTTAKYGPEPLIEAGQFLSLIRSEQAYVRDDDQDHFVLEAEREAGIDTIMRYLMIIHRSTKHQEEESNDSD